MKPRTLIPIIGISLLALAGCTNGNNNSASHSESSASADSAGISAPSATPTQDTEPFTLNDTMAFKADSGTTGTITFNATPPQDIALGLQWAGKPSGSWATIHVDNKQGTDAVSFNYLAPTLLDDGGTKYEMYPDSSVAANLYGDASSEDPHHDAYYDIYDKYNTGNGEVAVGEVKDMLLYSAKPLPQKLARGTMAVDATEIPLTIAK